MVGFRVDGHIWRCKDCATFFCANNDLLQCEATGQTLRTHRATLNSIRSGHIREQGYCPVGCFDLPTQSATNNYNESSIKWHARFITVSLSPTTHDRDQCVVKQAWPSNYHSTLQYGLSLSEKTDHLALVSEPHHSWQGSTSMTH